MKARRQLLPPESPMSDFWQMSTGVAQPVVLAQQGEELTLRLVNELETDIWLHFHGVRAAAEMMTVLVPPGDANAVEVRFTPPDAGTFLILPFLDASRGRDMGLHALLLVKEAGEPSGLEDVPLVLDDWIIGQDGKLDQNFGDLNAAIGEGRLGNWFTVNGSFKPRLAIDGSKSNRVRLANVSNTRTFTLQFKNTELYLLALDGQPVPGQTVPQHAVVVAPGQRMDLLLVNPVEQVIVSIDLFEDVVEAAFLPVSAGVPPPLAPGFTLPANPLPVPSEVAAAREIVLTIAGGAKGGLKSAKVGEEVLDLRAMLERGLAWAINGVAGLGGPLLFTANTGETLVLVIDNQTAFEQPLHIHGHVWQLIETNGQAAVGEPWRDTAVVTSRARIKLIMVADNPGQWAIHSLIAERQDAGLLGGFSVADTP